MNLEEGVQRLVARGFNAQIRDWAPGRSIVVFIGPAQTSGEISYFAEVRYLYLNARGTWTILDGTRARELDVENAEAALDAFIQELAAAEILARTSR